jgi:glycosyltransferase involved in cell wall biosynthesis
MKIPLLFNCRFATRPASGVDRVAAELLREFFLLSQQRAEDYPEVRLAVPGVAEHRAALAPHIDGREQVPIRRGMLRGHPWEQTELAWSDPDAWLFSPANVGPIFRRKQLALIHDAQPFTVPESYSPGFRTLYSAILPRLARRSRIIVTVSESARRDLERTGVAPPGKLHVIPNGTDHMDRVQEDPATLQRYRLEPGNYILAIGSLAPHKNLAMLLEVAATRSADSPELVVAGDKARTVFGDAGVDSTETPGFRLLGRVTDAELKSLYRHARALAFPSLTEGFGLPPLEAMRCGCPVIASTAAAVREVCNDAVIYADPREPGQWAEALRGLETNDELRAGLSARGTKQAANFTWRRAAERYLALLSAADRGSPR